MIIKKSVTIDFIADDLGHEYTEIPHYCNAVYGKQRSGITTGEIPAWRLSGFITSFKFAAIRMQAAVFHLLRLLLRYTMHHSTILI